MDFSGKNKDNAFKINKIKSMPILQKNQISFNFKINNIKKLK